jgi:mannose-6-phosphate isomerase-like protein (cupin superfamily)
MSTLHDARLSSRGPFVGLPERSKPVPFIPVVVRASVEDTGGGFELYEIGIPAGAVRKVAGDGPPPHLHREHEEVFYILDGEFTFLIDDETVAAPIGTVVVVPRGTRHGFSGKEGSRTLVFVIPGGLAGFFEELGAGLAAGHADSQVRAALAGRYDSYPEAR